MDIRVLFKQINFFNGVIITKVSISFQILTNRNHHLLWFDQLV